jgi:hypothetical protein
MEVDKIIVFVVVMGMTPCSRVGGTDVLEEHAFSMFRLAPSACKIEALCYFKTFATH